VQFICEEQLLGVSQPGKTINFMEVFLPAAFLTTGIGLILSRRLDLEHFSIFVSVLSFLFLISVFAVFLLTTLFFYESASQHGLTKFLSKFIMCSLPCAEPSLLIFIMNLELRDRETRKRSVSSFNAGVQSKSLLQAELIRRRCFQERTS